jgi:hypothetical protein
VYNCITCRVNVPNHKTNVLLKTIQLGGAALTREPTRKDPNTKNERGSEGERHWYKLVNKKKRTAKSKRINAERDKRRVGEEGK